MCSHICEGLCMRRFWRLKSLHLLQSVLFAVKSRELLSQFGEKKNPWDAYRLALGWGGNAGGSSAVCCLFCVMASVTASSCWVCCLCSLAPFSSLLSCGFPLVISACTGFWFAWPSGTWLYPLAYLLCAHGSWPSSLTGGFFYMCCGTNLQAV